MNNNKTVYFLSTNFVSNRLHKAVFVLFAALSLAACKPQLEALSVTDVDGNPLELVPAFDPEITDYTLADSYADKFVKVESTPSENTDTQELYSNRFGTYTIRSGLIQGDDALGLYIAPGKNDVAVHLANRFGDTTYHIKIHKPYVEEQTIQQVFEETLTEAYAESEAFGKRWDGEDAENVGMSAALYLPNGAFFSAELGVNRIGTNEPITADHLFPISSMTKSFIAALGLQLVREHDVYGLSLDDTVGDWLTDDDLPDPQYIPRDITLYQLLSHTSGLLRQSFGLDNVLDKLLINWTAEKWIKQRDIPATSSGYYSYADINYWLAGVILDRAIKAVDSNSSTFKEIRKRFLIPLNLRNTYFAHENFPLNRLAYGHFHDTSNILGGGIKGNLLNVLPFLNSTDKDIARKASYAGAMISNASDVARWLKALLHDQSLGFNAYGFHDPVPEVLTHEEKDYMLYDYGFGIDSFYLSYGAAEPAYGHFGDLGIFGGQMIYQEATGAVVVLLVNQGNKLFGGYAPEYSDIQSAILNAVQPYTEALTPID